MMMKKKRKRLQNGRYSDPEFILGYDFDNWDCTILVRKLQLGGILTEEENYRYGCYINAIVDIVLDGPGYRSCTSEEKEMMKQDAQLKILTKITRWKPTARIYSYMYKLAHSGCYWNIQHRIIDRRKEEKIQKHLDECMEDYLAEVSTKKVSTNEYED